MVGETAAAHRGARLPGSVWGIAGGLLVLLLAVANRYGWHRDELYFLEAGQHLQWGYVDQPPFTPFVARLAQELAPGNLVVLRLLPAVSAAVSVVLGALVVRELGGGRPAQTGGAAVVASGGFLLGVGHLLSTAVFDLTLSLALLWLLCRLLRTGDQRLWLAFGAVSGVALLNKSLVVLLVGALLVGLVLDRRWELLRSPWIIVGGALAALLASPNLLWQASNGWPQRDMAEALSERLATENRLLLLPMQLVFFGPFLLALLWLGARWLAGGAAGRPYRALLLAWPVGVVVVFATGGRPYYVLPLTLVVGLAGVAAWAEQTTSMRRLAGFVAANAVFSVLLALPVMPLSSVKVATVVNEAVAETVGWPELVDQLADVVSELPPEEQEGVVLLALTSGEAGAIDRFGPSRGLPAAHSGHNGYADFRRPTDDDATVVAVRYSLPTLQQWFEDCEEVGTVDNGLDVDNEVQGAPIVVCRGLRGTWAEVWPQVRFLS